MTNSRNNNDNNNNNNNDNNNNNNNIIGIYIAPKYGYEQIALQSVLTAHNWQK